MLLSTSISPYSLAAVAQGEAGVCGDEGMILVMWVAKNRGTLKGFYGHQRPTKHTVELATQVLKGEIDDPSKGAHYVYSFKDMKQRRVRIFTKKLTLTKVLDCGHGYGLKAYKP